MKKYLFILFIPLFFTSCNDDDPQETLKYVLTTEVKPENAGIISPASGSFEKGNEVKLEVTPAKGYIFKKWSGGVTGDSNPSTLIMNTDKKVIAEFEKIVPKTYVIKDDDWNNNIINIDETNYTFTFNSSIKDKYEIREGDFLVSTLNGGYLRRISEITISNNQINLKTEFAAITEAFTELSEEVSATLTPNYSSNDFWLDEGVKLDDIQAKGINTSISLDLEKTLYDFDNDPETDYDQIRISGNYSIGAGADIDIKISKAEIENLKIEFPLDQSLNIKGFFGVGSEYSLDEIIGNIPCSDIFLGPIVVTPSIEIHAGFTMNTTGSIELEYNQIKNSTTTMLYNGNDWQTTKSLTKENDFKDPIVRAEGNAKLYIKPQLKFKIYRTLSPYLESELSARAEATLNQEDIFWKTFIGYNLGVGVEMKIWKKTLIDFNFEAYQDEWLIKEGEYLKLDDNGLTPDINNLVPQDILDEIINLGMPINNGANPPQINNSYLVSPLVLVGSNISSDVIGRKYADYYFKLSNQNNNDLTVDLDFKQASTTGSGLGSFIVGTNNKFSVFSELTIINSTYNDKAKGVLVYSGEFSNDGIKDLMHAIFMVDDYGDPNNHYIEIGTGRVFHDSDKFSEEIDSFKHIVKKDNLSSLFQSN